MTLNDAIDKKINDLIKFSTFPRYRFIIHPVKKNKGAIKKEILRVFNTFQILPSRLAVNSYGTVFIIYVYKKIESQNELTIEIPCKIKTETTLLWKYNQKYVSAIAKLYELVEEDI